MKLELTYVDDNDNTIVYKKVLKRPKGRAARKSLPLLLDFMEKLQATGTSFNDDDPAQMISLIKSIWNYQQFEEELIPLVLQFNTDKERKLLDEEFTVIELLEPFFEAVSWTIQESLNKEGVQTALGKSKGEDVDGEEEAEPPQRTARKQKD